MYSPDTDDIQLSEGQYYAAVIEIWPFVAFILLIADTFGEN